jgi:hypothetical protein
MKAFEFKWNQKAKAKIPAAFLQAYPGTVAEIITPENMHEFLSEEFRKE